MEHLQAWLSEAYPAETSTDPNPTQPKPTQGTLPPTIKINPAWWELHERPVVSAVTAEKTLAYLYPVVILIIELTHSNDSKDLPLSSLSPLHFIHSLLLASFLFPPAVYTLILSQAISLQFQGHVAPFLTFIISTLLPSFTDATSLPLMHMAKHVTIRKNGSIIIWFQWKPERQ